MLLAAAELALFMRTAVMHASAAASLLASLDVSAHIAPSCPACSLNNLQQ